MTDNNSHTASSSSLPPSDWVETTLGEVIDFVVDNRGKTPPLVESGYELLEVNAISDNAREPDYSKVSKFVDEEVFTNGFRKGTIKKGDVLIPTVGTIGNASYSKLDRGAIAQNLIALRANNQNDSLFLYYFLTDPNTKKALLNLDIGGVQPSIKVPHLLGMQVVFPPLLEQQAIASVLSAFDEKIELLREQNKTLEEMGQVIFQEWFGKYGVDNELPDGWRVGKLGEELNIKQGKYVKAENLSEIQTEDKKYPIYGGSGIRGYIEDFMYEKPIVVLTCRGNGCGLIQFSKEKSSITNSCMAFENMGSFLSSEFIYFLSKKIDFESVTSGSAQPQITVTNLYNLEIIIPDQETLKQFDEAILPIFAKIRDNSEQIQSLARSRDELLPRLMSGQQRVKL
ncbi:MAG: restriction endonuclease subunit S [Candidatus Magasanikbacteria bacterium]|nr:restriction endonuclease subunit S [Candidatus Magasanikbacteria bacterium]